MQRPSTVTDGLQCGGLFAEGGHFKAVQHEFITRQQAFPAESLLFLGLQGGMQKNLKKIGKNYLT